MQDIPDSIVTSLTEAYRSFDAPDYAFVLKRHNARHHASVEAKLRVLYRLNDVTDFNDDRGYVWKLESPDDGYLLHLSLVGNYAYLARTGAQNRFDCVANEPEHLLTDGDRRIVSILQDANISLLEPSLLKRKIRWKNDSGLSEDIELFRVLFSDVETFPWH